MDYYDYAILKMVFETKSIAIVTLHKRLRRTDISKVTIWRKVKAMKKIGLIEVIGKSPMVISINEAHMREVNDIIQRNLQTFNIVG